MINPRSYTDDDFGTLWFKLVRDLFLSRNSVSPRGLESREILNVNLELTNPRANILISDARKLAYKYAIAEWLWIWFGHNDVETITQYNPNIHHFSDDGTTFAGAYGPRIVERWPQVIDLLRVDPDSRQAIMLIYRVPRGPTKDVPCTLTIQFLLRGDALHTIVNMRSSDIWLGLPYDVFTFTMLQNLGAADLGCDIGTFYMNLGSSHLYASNYEGARAVLHGKMPSTMYSPELSTLPPSVLDDVLKTKDYPVTGDLPRPWDVYADALCVETNADALRHLGRLR